MNRVTPLAEIDQYPADLEEVKGHLRVTEDVEDAMLRIYLQAATEWAEDFTNRAIALRTYLVVRDAFPVGPWALPLGKIKSVQSVQYIDLDGATQNWTASPLPYETDFDTLYDPRIRPKPTESWPSTGSYMGAARISLTAGWAQADVPNTVRMAILLMVGANDEHRAPGDEDPATIEAAAKMLLGRYQLPPWGPRS